MKGGKRERKVKKGKTALVAPSVSDPALQTAVDHWTDATTSMESPRRADIKRDKKNAALSFFTFCGKAPAEVTATDVKAWQAQMEGRGLAATTVYTRVCHLSSFFRWLMKDPALGQVIRSNPVGYAHPKAPKPYQTRGAKALTKQQAAALLAVAESHARSGGLTAKRDFAMLLLYLATGMRRSEVIGLRGGDLRIEDDEIVIRCRVKGGDYENRGLDSRRFRAALLDYLRSSRRLHVLRDDGPLWTRHDRAGEPGEPLSSWSFVENLKRYAKEAGIRKFNLHRTRHTFARMVVERTGSLSETQEALGHRHASTTRVYVDGLPKKKDKHSRYVLEALDLPEIEEAEPFYDSLLDEADDESAI
jgi:integrase/recombinase XerC